MSTPAAFDVGVLTASVRDHLEMTAMDENTLRDADPRSRLRGRWRVAAGLVVGAIAIGSAAIVLHQRALPATPAPRAATVAAPAMALAGSGSQTSSWFDLAAGTYQVSVKLDAGGPFSGQAIMRGVADPSPQPDCSRGCSNAQLPIVAQVGSSPVVVTLPAGHYVLDVAVVGRPAPWTLTVSKAGQ